MNTIENAVCIHHQSDYGRDLLTRLEQCKLREGEFNHESHILTAWLYIRDFGFDEGSQRFIQSIKAFAGHAGVPEKYHETITRALLQIIAAKMAQEPDLDYPGFKQRHSELFGDAREFLTKYYSTGCLKSQRARVIFLSPDIQELPAIN